MRLVLLLSATVMLTVASVAVSADAQPTEAAEFQASANGESLFRAKGCVGCHSRGSIGSLTNVGPNLSDLADRAGERMKGLSAEDYVRQSLMAPQLYVVPGFESTVEMPALMLSSDEVNALVDFLLEG